MKRRSRIAVLIALLTALVLALGGCAANGAAGKQNAGQAAAVTGAPAQDAPADDEIPEEAGPIIEPQRIADYLFAHGKLPENFITKREAEDLGWNSIYKYVSEAAPRMSIGGDRFVNYEGKLPQVKGRKYYECDCWYTEGRRSPYRIVYSDDGHVWYTEDHYETFTEMAPSGTKPAGP